MQNIIGGTVVFWGMELLDSFAIQVADGQADRKPNILVANTWRDSTSSEAEKQSPEMLKIVLMVTKSAPYQVVVERAQRNEVSSKSYGRFPIV